MKRESDEKPFISVVVPARNEEDNIKRLIDSLKRGSYGDYEVVVIDGASTDSTSRIAEDLGARVIEGPQKGTAVARNIGWKNARGEVIYFLDADWFLGDNTLEEVAKAFKEKNADTVGVNHRHYTDNWVSKAISAENKFGYKSKRALIIQNIINRIREAL